MLIIDQLTDQHTVSNSAFPSGASAFPTAAMGLLTSWIYPIRGVVYLLTTPQLLQLVLRFLGEPLP